MDGSFAVRLALHAGDNDSASKGVDGFPVTACSSSAWNEDFPLLSGWPLGRRVSSADATLPPDARSSAKRRSPPARSPFSGNGGKNLGTVKVPRNSTLEWTCDGDIFQIFDDEGGLFVNSQAHSGTSAVAAGSYHNVLVNAIGNWTITIRPNG